MNTDQTSISWLYPFDALTSEDQAVTEGVHRMLKSVWQHPNILIGEVRFFKKIDSTDTPSGIRILLLTQSNIRSNALDTWVKNEYSQNKSFENVLIVVVDSNPYGLRIPDLSSVFRLNISYGEGQNAWPGIIDLDFELRRILNDENKEQKYVFLADVSDELVMAREQLRRELRNIGFGVLPFHPTDPQSNTYTEDLELQLKNSILSVHLVTPVSDDLKQKDIASQLCDFTLDYIFKKNAPIRSLIWINETSSLSIDEQTLYIERLKRDPRLTSKTELVLAPIEKFKSILIDRANQPADQSLIDNAKIESQNPKVYLISDDSSSPIVTQLREVLSKKQIQLFSNDTSATDIHEHRNLLATCDGVLICHTHPNPQWLQMKLLDLVKAPGYGRKGAMKARAVLQIEQQEGPQLGIQKISTKQVTFSIDKFNHVIDTSLSDLIRMKAYGSLVDNDIEPFLKEILVS